MIYKFLCVRTMNLKWKNSVTCFILKEDFLKIVFIDICVRGDMDKHKCLSYLPK